MLIYIPVQIFFILTYLFNFKYKYIIRGSTNIVLVPDGSMAKLNSETLLYKNSQGQHT